jgi:ribosome biogenesis GTPase A
LTPAFNISKKIFPCSVRFRNGINLWKAVEVRFVSGVTEDSADTDKRDLSVLNIGSSSKYDENHESRLLRIAIIGIPNVGKSTVINQLVGRKVNIKESFILKSV